MDVLFVLLVTAVTTLCAPVCRRSGDASQEHVDVVSLNMAVGTVTQRPAIADWSLTIRPVLIVGAYLAAWTMLDRLAALFETAPDVSIWYPPFALDMALLAWFKAGLHVERG